MRASGPAASLITGLRDVRRGIRNRIVTRLVLLRRQLTAWRNDGMPLALLLLQLTLLLILLMLNFVLRVVRHTGLVLGIGPNPTLALRPNCAADCGAGTAAASILDQHRGHGGR